MNEKTGFIRTTVHSTAKNEYEGWAKADLLAVFAGKTLVGFKNEPGTAREAFVLSDGTVVWFQGHDECVYIDVETKATP